MSMAVSLSRRARVDGREPSGSRRRCWSRRTTTARGAGTRTQPCGRPESADTQPQRRSSRVRCRPRSPRGWCRPDAPERGSCSTGPPGPRPGRSMTRERRPAWRRAPQWRRLTRTIDVYVTSLPCTSSKNHHADQTWSRYRVARLVRVGHLAKMQAAPGWTLSGAGRDPRLAEGRSARRRDHRLGVIGVIGGEVAHERFSIVRAPRCRGVHGVGGAGKMRGGGRVHVSYRPERGAGTGQLTVSFRLPAQAMVNP